MTTTTPDLNEAIEQKANLQNLEDAQEASLASFWRKFVTRLFILTIVLTLGAVGIVSIIALKQFQTELAPEFQKQATVVGRTVASQLDRAFSAGIALEDFYGMDEYLDAFLKSNKGISYIAITDRSGKQLYGRGNGLATVAKMNTGLPMKLPTDTSEEKGAATPSAPAPNAGAAAVPGTEVKPAAKPAVVNTQVKLALIDGFYDSSLYLVSNNVIMGRLHVGVEERKIDQQNYEILFDVVIVTLVALLAAFEFILFVVAVTIMLPTRLVSKMLSAGRLGDFSWVLPPTGGDFGIISAQLNNVSRRVNQLTQDLREDAAELVSLDINGKFGSTVSRIVEQAHRSLKLVSSSGARHVWDTSLVFARTPLFLFVFAQEMCRPFFPSFVGSVFTQPSWLPQMSPQTAISLPISMAMLIAAIMTPLSGIWSDRVGRRKVFVIGASFAAAGLALSGSATGFTALMIWWCFGAIGYGMVFIACQSYVLDNTTAAGRAQGIAVYLGAIMAGDICGPAIGGVLADRAGFQATFMVAAFMTALGAYIANQTMGEAPREAAIKRSLPSLSDFKLLAKNWRLLSLVVFASMPGKMLLAGFLFFLAPIYLTQIGNDQAVIGRVLMCYGLAALFVTPISGHLFNSRRSAISAVGTAVILQGIALGVLYLRSDTLGMVIAIALFGLGQALASSPQTALVPTLAAREAEKLGSASVLGVYRLMERAGQVSGPLLVAALLTKYSATTTFTILGVIMVSAGVMFLLLLATDRRGGETSAKAEG